MEDHNVHIWDREEPQPIAVPLLGQYAQHNPNQDQRSYNFVGREHLIKELVTALNETRETKGCYLISGFRGTGKTTLINKVLNLYAKGATTPAWLSAEVGVTHSRVLKSLLLRGRKKLVGHSSASKINLSAPSTMSWLTRIKNRFFSPLI